MVSRVELIRFQRACLRDGRTAAVRLADEAQLRLLRRHGDFDRLLDRLALMNERKRRGFNPLGARVHRRRPQ